MTIPTDVTGRVTVALAGSTGSEPAARRGAWTRSRSVVSVAAQHAGHRPRPFSEGQVHHTGFVEYFGLRFFPHEPMYFLIGAEDPAAKFQISFKYKVLNDDGTIAKAVPPLGGLYIGYSQTSFWDLGEQSRPFFDNSYRPELLLSYDNVLPRDVKIPGVSRIGLQFALHESNGRDGAASRSLNIAYLRPIFVFGNENGFSSPSSCTFFVPAGLERQPGHQGLPRLRRSADGRRLGGRPAARWRRAARG